MGESMYRKLNYGALREYEGKGRLVLKGGLVVDPENHLEAVKDVVIADDSITMVTDKAEILAEDRVIDCAGLEVWPVLIDMHLHVSDLYEISTGTVFGAAEDGVTTALTPGAGNTFMTPALLGAETDRGVPLNIGAYIGAANVLGTKLNQEELIRLFRGELPDSIKEEKLSRNWIVNRTAAYAVGIKEHMGHFLLPDDKLDGLFEVTEQAGLLFMSHTQDIEHTEKVVSIAKGRRIHLGHANAVGCGTHGEPVQSMKRIRGLLKQETVSGEFVTTMLRKGRGSREGLQMVEAARQIALQAVADGEVRILVSDGQNHSVMKGFGDTRDNIACILELTENHVLDRRHAVAMMTANPAKLLRERTKCREWEKYGNLSRGSYANIVVVDTDDKMATYVITNGKLTAFEHRYLRMSGKAGYWVSRFGTCREMGIGGLALYTK